MEFEHVGSHCSFATCHQKDFLPFMCDSCKQPFCLAHRSYAGHECSKGLAKDITSFDCPVCQKSVRFSKADDPNVMWDRHFTQECKQVPSTKTKLAQKKCPAQGCTTAFGPSNQFQCPKCRQTVCLSHRLPEDHQCPSLKSNRPTANTRSIGPFIVSGSGSNKGNSTKSNSSAKRKPPTTTTNAEENSLRGSAQRRVKSNPNPPISTSTANSSSGGDEFVCPFCDLRMSSVDALQDHIQQTHPDPVTSPNTTTRTSRTTGGGGGATGTNSSSSTDNGYCRVA